MTTLVFVWRQVCKKASEEGNKGVLAQILEILGLKIFHGIGPNFYLLSGFSTHGIPWGQMTSHKSARAYYKWLDRVNPAAYRKLSQNKLAEKSILRLMNIPSTEFLGFFHPTRGIDTRGEALHSSAQLFAMLSTMKAKTIVVKPLEGSGGSGVRALDIEVSAAQPLLRDRVTDEQFILSPELDIHHALFPGNDEGWIIERYFPQHPMLSRLNGSSVNTIRVWVRRHSRSDTAKCIGAYFRIGRRDSIVDNRTSGGIVCPVANATGVLGMAHCGTPERKLYSHHPDSGEQIEGTELPYWKEAQELAIKTLECFPEMYFCGLDVAIGEHGPVIVELNPCPAKEGAALMQISFPE